MPKSTIHISLKIILIIFAASTGVFSAFTYLYYQEGQVKASVIRFQAGVIDDQTNRILSLDAKIDNLTKVVGDQGLRINQMNVTIFEQNDTIGRQIVELGRRAIVITSLESNVNKLSGEVTKKEQEIISLTPITKSFFVAAVKGDGGGAIIPLDVKILSKGTNLLSVNIKNVDLQSGAQESIRLAASIASKLSGESTAQKDIDVSFVNTFADLVSVDGPSAGGAITATIYAALKGTSLPSNVMMTGTIEPDGTIGKVGGVDKKAEAARSQGASKFLVPKGQKVTVSGIDIVEVATINDVFNQLGI